MTAMRRQTARALLLLIVLAVVMPLAGCGKKAAPLPPDGNEFPRQYPFW